jgi:hypothetical protein
MTILYFRCTVDDNIVVEVHGRRQYCTLGDGR